MLETFPFRFTAGLDPPGHELSAGQESEQNCETYIFVHVIIFKG